MPFAVAPSLPVSREDCGNVVLIDQPEAAIDEQLRCDGELLVHEHEPAFVQNRIVDIRRISLLRRVVTFVHRIAVKVGTAVNGNRILRHIKDEEPAPIEAVVQRSADWIAAKIIHCVDGKLSANRSVESSCIELNTTRTEQKQDCACGGYYSPTGEPYLIIPVFPRALPVGKNGN